MQFTVSAAASFEQNDASQDQEPSIDTSEGIKNEGCVSRRFRNSRAPRSVGDRGVRWDLGRLVEADTRSSRRHRRVHECRCHARRFQQQGQRCVRHTREWLYPRRSCGLRRRSGGRGYRVPDRFSQQVDYGLGSYGACPRAKARHGRTRQHLPDPLGSSRKQVRQQQGDRAAAAESYRGAHRRTWLRRLRAQCGRAVTGRVPQATGCGSRRQRHRNGRIRARVRVAVLGRWLRNPSALGRRS